MAKTGVTRVVNPLTPTEISLFTKHDKIVKKTGKAAWEFVESIAVIREGNLYREKFSTFDDYCKARTPYSKRHVDRLISASEKRSEMGHDVPKPDTETQARALPDDPVEAAETWRETQEATGEEQPSAAAIAEVVESRADTFDTEEPTSPPVVSIVLDGMKRAVPEHLTEQHDIAAQIQSTARDFDKLRKSVRELAKNSGGTFIHVQEIELGLQGLKKTLNDSRYYTECPTCRGAVKKSCKRCKGAGFVSHAMKGVLSDEEQEWLGK